MVEALYVDISKIADAIANNNVELVKKCLDRGLLEPTTRISRYSETTAIAKACSNARTLDILKLFLNHEPRTADKVLVNTNCGPAIHSACLGANLEAVKLIINYLYDIEYDRIKDYINVVDGGLDSVRDPNCIYAGPGLPGGFGFTPLHRACAIGDMRTAKFLLEHGADPTLRSHLTEFTPLGLAVANFPRRKDEFEKVFKPYMNNVLETSSSEDHEQHHATGTWSFA